MEVTPADRLQKLPPYLFADLRRKMAEARAAGQEVISLGIGDPDQPTPDPVVQECIRAINDEADANRHRYGCDVPTPEFPRAVKDFYRRRFGVELADEQIVATMGSKDAIAKLCLTLLNPGDLALAPEPGYPTYNIGHTFASAVTHYMPLVAENGFLPDLDAIPAHVLRLAKVMWLNYPNNPTTATCDLAFYRRVVAFAREHGLPAPTRIQHHQAHVAACLVDNGWAPDRGPVIGVALDGTGYGEDGHIWGGEWLVGDYHGYRRAAHLEYLPLPGGDAATRNPWRIAVSYLYTLLGEFPQLPFLTPLKKGTQMNAGCARRSNRENPRSSAKICVQKKEVTPSPLVLRTVLSGGSFLDGVDTAELDLLHQQLDRRLNCPLTSSMGRLFDAVSALLGVCGRTTYEAQAAIELEMVASGQVGKLTNQQISKSAKGEGYPFRIEAIGDHMVVRLRELFAALLADLQAGMPVAKMAWRFHQTVAQMTVEVCERIAADTGLHTVALSGGCYQNRLLLALTVPLLEAAGFRVLLHRQVPCNDGGLSLGQAVIAHFAA